MTALSYGVNWLQRAICFFFFFFEQQAKVEPDKSVQKRKAGSVHQESVEVSQRQNRSDHLFIHVPIERKGPESVTSGNAAWKAAETCDEH